MLALVALALAASGCSPEPSSNLSSEPLTPVEKQGQDLFVRYCAVCHSLQADTVIVGPSMAGLASRAGMAEPGKDAAAYIRESIMEPSAHIVESFADLMPPTLSQLLSEDDVSALVSFLLTLK